MKVVQSLFDCNIASYLVKKTNNGIEEELFISYFLSDHHRKK